MSAPQASTGAALLAFLLVLVTGAGWLLLSGLDRHAHTYTRQADSARTLNRAKQALLSYAMNYPDLRTNPEKGPGFLPCPDRNNDGRPESNCAATTGTTLGRLPFAILGLDDPRDGSGQRLWYALSPDFRNTRSNYAALNSETPGQLSVDGMGDVVAVVLAPGAPVGAQGARPSNRAADYLEGVNADVTDARFSAAAGNDRLLAIRRAEFMRTVELRVANEVRAALARWRAEHGAYPRLARYAHPHVDNRVLRGAHNGNNNSRRLRDSRRDFPDWGVRPYDVVRNVTDGSVAVVKAVRKHTLELSAPGLGKENDFDRGDGYFIELRGPARHVSGTAAAGSVGALLKDPGRDFLELGIIPGDVIENLSDGAAATVAQVDRKALTLERFSGGTDDGFEAGESYRLLTNTGTAGAGSAALTLADPGADFMALGVAAGNLVENLSDGSTGRVNNVAGPGLLTVSGLRFGRLNRFREHDVYRLPRYNPGSDARHGLLPLHEPGKRFATGFSVTWNVPVSDAWVITGERPGLHPGYLAAVTAALRSSAPAGPSGVAVGAGYCAWLKAQVVDCAGLSGATALAAGHTTVGAAAGILTDGARDFVAAGIKPGDLVEAPYLSVVTRVASATTLHVMPLPGAGRALAPGADYRIRVATGLLRGTVEGGGARRLYDSRRDFNAAGIQAGDIVENLSDGSFGLVSAVSAAGLSAALQGGRHNAYHPGDEYQVFHAYVNRRRYHFSLRYQGQAVTHSMNGRRQREVCLGHGADCTGAAGAATLPFAAQGIAGSATTGTAGLTLHDGRADFLRAGIVPGDTLFNLDDGSAGMVTAVGRRSLVAGALHGGHLNHFTPGAGYRVGRPLLIIEDLDEDRVVTRTGLAAAPGGAPGAIRTTGIDYLLAEAPARKWGGQPGKQSDRTLGTLPPWFIKNKWHRLVHIAYGAGFAPGGSGRCNAGVDCLVIRGGAEDIEALVVTAGMALPHQRRATGAGAAYYEADNVAVDDVFARARPSENFNDQVIAVAP